MFKFYFLSFCGLLLTMQLSAQTYYTGWDTGVENANWVQVKKGDMSTYEWILEFNSPLSPDSALTHYYPVGGSIPTDDWFISPVFDFFGGGRIDSLWRSYSGFGTPMAGDSIALYLLNGSTDPDLATKTILYSFTDSTYFNDGIWRKDSNIFIPPTSGNSYLAFRYYTTNNWLDIKFDNLTVTSIPQQSGIAENNPNIQVNIFPNPVHSNLTIDLGVIKKSSILNLSIINLNGQIVKTLPIDNLAYDISDLNNGFYFLVIDTLDNHYVKKVSVAK